jgi:hypothetical protein
MKKILFFILLAVIVIAAHTGLSSESAKEILAKAKQASGGAAWDSIRSIYTKTKITAAGLNGTAESWEDILTGRTFSRIELGPMTGARGFDGKVLWSQDSSKQVRAEEGGDAREGGANEAYRRSLSYWFPVRWEGRIEYSGEKQENNRQFHVIRITPKDGRPFDIWIDGATYLFDRIVEKTALETRTTFLSDYRQISGIKVPFNSRSTNGEERYDQLGTTEKVELNVLLKDEMFRMPLAPAPDFLISGGKTSTTIPFELRNNHIYLQVKLNGQGPFELLCDTGGANIVTPELAKGIGLKYEGTLQGRGVGEKSEDVALTKIQTLQVGEATISNQLFAVFPLSTLANVEGQPMHGLIGYEVFKRFVVKIDYENSRLTLMMPSSFSYSGSGMAVPFKFNGHVPQVEGEIDAIPGKFDIDTGGRTSLTILAPFAEKHNLKARYGAKVEAVVGWGIGGPARGLVTRAKILKLGSIAIENPVTELSLQTKGAFIDPYVAGNVGAGVLKRFNIIFDYTRQQLIFERNANDSLPDNYDRAGMWLNLENGTFQVADVVAGGPAEQAGLKSGDSILAIEGKTPAQLPLLAARTKFKSDPPGTKVRLVVISAGKKKELTMTLRDLI